MHDKNKLKKPVSKDNVNVLVLELLFQIIGTALISILAMLVFRGFVFNKETLFGFLSGWIMLLFFALGTFYYVKMSGNNKLKSSVLLSTVLFNLAICIIMAKFINIYSIPFMLVALMLLMLTDRFTANIVNVTTTAMFTVLFLIANESISRMNIITLISFIICGMFIVSVIKSSDTRIMIILKTLILAFIIFLINFVAVLFINAHIMMTLKDTFWIMLGWVFSVCIFMVIMPIYESIFGLVTDLKLAELCNHNHPMLKELKEKAPGTFNHSVFVANLAEACAVSIGESPMLARASAYYHDYGKIKNPEYFSENQRGTNPHDNLIPEASAAVITKHTGDGYAILKEKNIPEEIAKVAIEHHGDAVVTFFYNKAQNISETTLSTENYRYNNIKPTTKIAAIVMICDTCEAATRSLNEDYTIDELRTFISNLITQKRDSGQFDNCDITMKDLKIITETIVDYIPSVFHKRIQYNNAKETK